MAEGLTCGPSVEGLFIFVLTRGSFFRKAKPTHPELLSCEVCAPTSISSGLLFWT